MATALRSLFELMGSDAALRGRELSNRNAELQIDDFEAAAPARDAERRLSTIVSNAKAQFAPRAVQMQVEGDEVALQGAKIAQSAKLNELQKQLLGRAVDQSSFDGAIAELEQLGGKPHPLRGKMFTPGLKKEFTDELSTAAQQIEREKLAWQQQKDIEEIKRRNREEALNREKIARDTDLNERKFNAGLDFDNRKLAISEREAGRKAPSGYRFTPEGDLTPIPGGPADVKAAQKNEAQLGALDAVDTTIESLKLLQSHKGKEAATGAGAFFNDYALPGSKRRGFLSQLETFKAQTFVPMVSQLKGMGALSDAEGKKLQEAVGALNPAMPEEEFNASLDRIMADLNRKKARLSGGSVTSGPAAPTASGLKPGTVDGGYIFLGGNPADPKSWKKQ